MKKAAHVFVMCIMSLLMFNAYAQNSGNNSVYIDQTNADNSTITITQTGSGNQVGDRTNLLTLSFLIDGNNMNLVIEQDGMNNTIVGNFIGGDSNLNIYQFGSGNLSKLTMGNFGTTAGNATITFNGDNNTSEWTLANNSNAGDYNYTLTVTGNSNIVTSTMNSRYIHNTIAITGNSNQFTTVQYGANGSSLTPGHKIESAIIGDGNIINITQNGTTTPNIVTLNVTGSNTVTNITQH
jgi:hypothetical protein